MNHGDDDGDHDDDDDDDVDDDDDDGDDDDDDEAVCFSIIQRVGFSIATSCIELQKLILIAEMMSIDDVFNFCA